MKNGLHLLTALLLLSPSAAVAQVRLESLGTIRHGDDFRGAAEIVSFDATNARLAVVNGQHQSVDLVDIRDPHVPKMWKRVDLSEYGDTPTSVAVGKATIAVALCRQNADSPGTVALLGLDGVFQTCVAVGFHPDMVTFTPDGKTLLVANEGEPSEDYAIDPEGSISMIDVDAAISGSDAAVTTMGFSGFDKEPLDGSIRVFGPGARPAQDFEPEFIAVAPNGRYAMATLQENNAVAIVDLTKRTITDVIGLGFKDHRQPGSGLDASDLDGKVDVRPLPVWGMYQPDAIAAFTAAGETFFITANEGDARFYEDYSEIARCGELELDDSFAEAKPLLGAKHLGRLQVTRTLGDDDGDGRYEAFYAFGARSFSIWNDAAQLVYDSGDALERISLERFPEDFNSNNDGSSRDDQSDERGPEPESVTVGQIGDRTLAFLGLERPSAIFVIDVTTPTAPVILSVYHDSMDASHAGATLTRNRGPEGLCFISAEDSPNGRPLLAVSYEVSGTTRIFQVVQHEQAEIVEESHEVDAGVGDQLGTKDARNRAASSFE